jgi:hypothetical protein
VEASEAYTRALDIDSTFALAAIGLSESSYMGFDEERLDDRARALEVMLAHADRLPPRDRAAATGVTWRCGGCVEATSVTSTVASSD